MGEGRGLALSGYPVENPFVARLFGVNENDTDAGALLPKLPDLNVLQFSFDCLFNWDAWRIYG